MRLDKFLADCGLGSRTDVKRLIKSGKITVDGLSSLKPETRIDENCNRVFFMGKPLSYRKYIYLMMNKPPGYVSATWDKKLPTVVELLPEEYRHFEPFPVGRLDIDTKGLLLLTNDGELAHRLLSPKHHVPKTYVAVAESPVTDDAVTAFFQGMDLGDFVTMPAELKILSANGPYVAEVTICEGKFHQVKRMFEKVDNRVLELTRIKMKNLTLDEDLQLGDVRPLTETEIKALKEVKT